MRLRLIRGDLTRERADAIVNAANSSLLGGGGVDGAIHRAGGPAILAACRQLRQTTHPDGLPAGRAAVTEAGELPARWVIHTVGPVWDGTDRRAPLLRACYTESLRVAAGVGARTIAFPAISTGAYRWPMDSAARLGVEAVRSVEPALEEAVDEVRFVVVSDAAEGAFRAALDG
ncbi:MAG: O-acetyl-ADP-ribose deacetylase [Mycobacteriales bacterium]|nr:MAG: O-acetyl-ADP-ribose deacetylase [Pseudonocardiales bacterium]